MAIKKVLEILKAFERYVDFINNHGNDEVIDSIVTGTNYLLITLRGHMGEKTLLKVYLYKSTNELYIDIAGRNESVFDYIDIDALETTQEEIDYVRYGNR